MAWARILEATTVPWPPLPGNRISIMDDSCRSMRRQLSSQRNAVGMRVRRGRNRWHHFIRMLSLRTRGRGVKRLSPPPLSLRGGLVFQADAAISPLQVHGQEPQLAHLFHGVADALAADARFLHPAVGHVVDAEGRDVVEDDAAAFETLKG